MFDLSKINFIDDSNRTNSYSFVGLQRNSKNNSMDFYLPIGFNDFETDSFDKVKELFLGLYKIFKKFQKNKIKDRDGSLNKKGGFEFKTVENETILLYSKINMFDTILNEFDEMEVYSFHIKRANSDNIDYSKLDKYMDRAIFLEDDIIYLDEVEINKDVLHFDESELVEMFCYLYWDIKKALDEEEDIPPHIVSLALNFREEYLTYESSLFEEDSFAITKDTLKERLEIIDKKSLLKDAVYDKFYDAIYIFLYGNPFFEGDNDIYWGINNFSFIWEEMGHHYFFDKYKDKILFADTDSFEETKVGGNDCYKKDDFKYPFVLKYDSKEKCLYPDLVVKYTTGNYKEFSNIEDFIFKDEVSASSYFRIKIQLSLENRLGGSAEIEKKYSFKKHLSTNPSYIKSNMINDYSNERSRDKAYNELIKKIKEDLFKVIIIDFKYSSKNNLEEKGIKVVNDIKKQLLYKLALQSTDDNLIVKNIFYLPYYLEKTTHTKREIENLHKSDIKVKSLNFNDAKKSYLEYKNDK